LRDEFNKMLDYIHKMEAKYGTVMLMNRSESHYMIKLSTPCYKNDWAKLNKYETTIIRKYLKGDINVRQMSYYLGGITDEKADRKARLYQKGRYEITNHKNYWEIKK